MHEPRDRPHPAERTCTVHNRNSEHTHIKNTPKKVIQTSRAVDCKHIQSIRAFFCAASVCLSRNRRLYICHPSTHHKTTPMGVYTGQLKLSKLPYHLASNPQHQHYILTEAPAPTQPAQFVQPAQPAQAQNNSKDKKSVRIGGLAY